MGAIKLNLPFDKQLHVEVSTLCVALLIFLCIGFKLYAYHLWIPFSAYAAAVGWELYGMLKAKKPFSWSDVYAGTSKAVFMYLCFLAICMFNGLI